MADASASDLEQRRAAWMEALKSETEKRRAAWRSALEPEQGCTFEVYVQNPYVLPSEEEDAYRTQLKVSRPPLDPGGRCVHLGPLVPHDQQRQVFGDDEIYVANYRNKKPYEMDYPYYYPADKPDWLKENRPPSERPIPPLQLGRFAAAGCYHCVERPALWCVPEGADGAAPKQPLLGSVPNPVLAPDFGIAMVYATVRRALDIWKVYLDWDNRFAAAVAKTFPWHFQPSRPRLEIVPIIKDGIRGLASSGFGYIQLGCGETDNHHTVPLEETDAAPQDGAASWPIPYWLNPDVLVHELGHHLLYGTLGFGPGVQVGVQGPDWCKLWEPQENGDDFRAFHEAFSDIVAIVVAMHHPQFLDRILRETEGDLFSVNALTSVAEISRRKTIRNTMNNKRVGDVQADSQRMRYYQLSQVVAGALFDVLAGFAVRYLAEYEQLPADILSEWERAYDRRLEIPVGAPSPEQELVDEIQAIYRAPDGPAVVESAVVRARDALGWLLGSYVAQRADGSFDPASFTLAGFKRDLMDVASRQDSDVSEGLNRPTLTGALKRHVIEQCFRWRGI